MQLRLQASGRDGYEVIVRDNPGLRHIREFGILRLDDGETYESETGPHEAILHVVEGRCALTAREQQFTDLGDRPTPFAGRPTAIYLPPNTPYAIQGQRVEIAITLARATAQGEPAVIFPQDIAPKQVGQGNWQRTVTMIAPPEFPSQKLILGETVNPSGNWSGVPTHKHDTHEPKVESVHEELYYFRVDRPGGWGVERIYDKRDLDQLVLLQDRAVTMMPRGYHTVAAAPGFTLYYAFVLAGPAKPLRVTLDPDQAWLGS
jgi:5-deoxy-glucuronate isomerase